MSGAAGLAAARRRRGNPQPTPQRMPQQPPPVPQQQPRGPPVSPQGAAPTSPLDILHQHHIQLDTHDKMLNELKSNLDTIKDLYATQAQEAAVSMPSQTEMEMTPDMLEKIKVNMIDPLENDLQSVLNGYQLKIDMLSTTLNSQQNYILELNTTLLGVVKQMTKLLAIKEKEVDVIPNIPSEGYMPSSALQERIDTHYVESPPPDPFYPEDNSPIATFGTAPPPVVIAPITPLAEEKNEIGNITDILEEDERNNVNVFTPNLPEDISSELNSDPIADLSVE